jgi:sialic acid synthase SpsE
MKVGSIDLDREVLVIAEVGNNHEGDFALAERLVGLAAEAGAGAVKFQTITPDRLVSARETARIRQLERFQLSRAQFTRLSEVARDHGILFLSTPFDLDSARFLEPLVPAFKISSGDNTFFPLLELVASTGKPIILSTGLMALDDVARSRDFIQAIWRREGFEQEMAVLHCVVNYPTAPVHANLGAIQALHTLGVTVGYSDHTLGIEAAVLSVALGARVIEKHFTIDKNHSDFRDHQLSADPGELAELVRRVKQATVLLGSGRKVLEGHEAEVMERVRRSIVARRDLEPGNVITWEVLDWVRPGGGLAPGRELEILDRILARPVGKGDWILPEHCQRA